MTISGCDYDRFSCTRNSATRALYVCVSASRRQLHSHKATTRANITPIGVATPPEVVVPPVVAVLPEVAVPPIVKPLVTLHPILLVVQAKPPSIFVLRTGRCSSLQITGYLCTTNIPSQTRPQLICSSQALRQTQPKRMLIFDYRFNNRIGVRRAFLTGSHDQCARKTFTLAIVPGKRIVHKMNRTGGFLHQYLDDLSCHHGCCEC
ncbi:MAG: hypothetical protein H6R18_934 [Proteobacteria bacterium]|nr:hypothetical protein [Pseudomonadota bacterium]